LNTLLNPFIRQLHHNLPFFRLDRFQHFIIHHRLGRPG
jgi:hypothetical protein